MKKIILILGFLISINVFSQEVIWDQGIPLCPDNEYINNLTSKIDLNEVREDRNLSDKTRSTCRDIGLAFYDLGFKEEADWYLTKSKDFHYEGESVKLEKVKKEEEPKISQAEMKSMEADLKFLESMPKSFEDIPPKDLKNIAKQIELQIQKLLHEKDSLLKTINPNKDVIQSKDNMIGSLKKDKEIVGLTIESQTLKSETKGLKVKALGLEIEKESLKKYLWISGIVLLILILGIAILLQRKTIKVQDIEIEKQLEDISKKNTYIEHAARIIRHDMHSGINTYMPRGINSLEKRLTEDDIKTLKIDGPIKMIKEGLNHTQKVYKSVYEFTNLIKQNVVLEKKKVNLKEVLDTYLSNTSFKSQVEISELFEANVNEVLFCNAIDNLIKNGLKYNDSENKEVKIYMEGDYLIVKDNGRGLSEKKFEKIITSKPKEGKEEGLGLNICLAILSEHGFNLSCQKEKIGTKMRVKLK
jgi:K+-sensing histidine kinase KdpD